MAFLALGCGGGGGGSDGVVLITGLEAPDQMSVVTPSSGVGSAGADAQDSSTFPADSDYATDPTSVHVFDPATEPIQMVNEILCLMGQTRYSALVNQGDYIAQIDADLCAAGEDPNSGGQTAAAGTNLETWTVNSSRASNVAPEIVKIWVPNEEQGHGPGTIRVKLQVDAGVSDANPFGVFAMNFAGVDDATGDVDDPTMRGSLQSEDALTGFIGFSFFEQKGDPAVDPGADNNAEIVQANVNMFADQSQGVARVHVDHRENFSPGGDSGLLSDEYLIAFNDEHLLRQINGGPTVALSRTDVTEHVWRYNLYYNTGADAGQRVELDSGFQFRTAAGAYGWIGYWGYWLPDGATLADGETIERVSFGDDTTTPYTFRLAPGKLWHLTRRTIALTELGGIEFEWYYFIFNFPYQTRVRWQNGAFEVVAHFDFGTQTWVDDEPSVPIDTGAVGSLNMWSRQLAGQCLYTDGATDVVYFHQEVVKGDDPLFLGGASVDLYGYTQCLDAGILGVDADTGDVLLDDSIDVAQPWHYVFDQGDLTLRLDVNGDGSVLTQVGLADGESISGGPNFWGMRSGTMVLDTSGLTTTADLFAATDFYVYETGQNSWNQLAGVVDPATGGFVDFDAPIEFLYQHLQANDRNGDATHAGESFVLSYNGDGQLGGLPFAAVDTNGDGNPDRYYPLVDLGDGVLVGPTGVEYVVKAIDVEQQLTVDPAGAPELSLGGAAILALPDGSSYVTPDIGAAPVVTDPPAVIAGVLQGTLGSIQQ